MSKPPISKTRHNLGEAFQHALDDIRQKVVEEGWTGSTQTPSAVLNMQTSDFVAWLYGGGDRQADRTAGIEGQATAQAIDHALKNGATGTAHEIAAHSGLQDWCAGKTATQPEPPQVEPDGIEL